MTDTLRRDDLKTSDTSRFDSLSSATQRVLKRAASRGTANSTAAIRAEVDADWIMVPSRRGLRQVVVTSTRAYSL